MNWNIRMRKLVFVMIICVGCNPTPVREDAETKGQDTIRIVASTIRYDVVEIDYANETHAFVVAGTGDGPGVGKIGVYPKRAEAKAEKELKP